MSVLADPVFGSAEEICLGRATRRVLSECGSLFMLPLSKITIQCRKLQLRFGVVEHAFHYRMSSTETISVQHHVDARKGHLESPFT